MCQPSLEALLSEVEFKFDGITENTAINLNLNYDQFYKYWENHPNL